MNKKMVYIFLSIFAVICLFIVPAFYVFNTFYRPANELEMQAKNKAQFLLKLLDENSLNKVGEEGFGETIDSKTGCYTYVFQGKADYDVVKNTAVSNIESAGFIRYEKQYMKNKYVTDKFDGSYRSTDGWNMALRVIDNANLSKLTGGSRDMDYVIETTDKKGEVLVASQVCKSF